jgi:hypothetical protein
VAIAPFTTACQASTSVRTSRLLALHEEALLIPASSRIWPTIVWLPVASKDCKPPGGDPDIPCSVWNEIEGLAYLCIWHVLLSF